MERMIDTQTDQGRMSISENELNRTLLLDRVEFAK